MSDIDAIGGMTAEDQSYFSTGGASEPAQAAEPSPAPAEQAEAAQEQPEAPQAEEKKFIPLSELAKERERRRELQQRIENERVERARLEERLNILAQQMQPRQQEAPTPSFEEDPASYLLHQSERTGQTVEQLQRQLAERQEYERQQYEQQQFIGSYKQQAAQFAQQNPDFREAYAHWVTNIKEELADAGVTDPQAVVRELQGFERNIVAKAMQDGVNPAERLYKLAQRRGYKRAEAPQAADKMATIAKGAQAARSLSSASGAAPRGTPSLEALATMSDDEFSEMTSGGKWEKLFG